MLFRSLDALDALGALVGGVRRGVEGVEVCYNDFQGCGKTVNGSTYGYTSGFEFGNFWPDPSDNTKGRSSFHHNKVGRCGAAPGNTQNGAWWNIDYAGVKYLTISDNVFDSTYNPGGCELMYSSFAAISGADHVTFSNNTWNMAQQSSRPWAFFFDTGGANFDITDCAFSGESFANAYSFGTNQCTMPFPDSTFTDFTFNVQNAVIFPASASGTGCTFANGSSGGTFT